MSSTVTVSSDDFLTLLSAAKTTVYSGKEADPALVCIYLASARAQGEEGETDVLVAVSSDGLMSGQTIIEADGQLPHPILVDLKANSWVTALVKNAKTNMQKLEGKGIECTVELAVTGSEQGLGGFLHLQTKTDTVPGPHDNKGIVPLSDTEYPIGDVMNDLTPTVRRTMNANITDASGTQKRVELPDGQVMGYSDSQINLMKAITAAVGEPVLQYHQGHTANRRTLTCGSVWRGTVPGYEFDPDIAEEPSVELVDLKDKG